MRVDPNYFVPYTCIEQDVKSEIVVKKSRFICDLCYIEDLDAAQKRIAAIKKEHYNARHHCSAMVLLSDRSFQRASDDGEPQGTAGLPMLEVLKGSGLTNILAVVTRYFGGTLLGTGGLVRAYGDSVKEALHHIKKIEYLPAVSYAFTVSYADYGKLCAIAEEFGAHIQAEFEEQVNAAVVLENTVHDQFEKRATQAFLGADVFTRTGQEFIKRPVI